MIRTLSLIPILFAATLAAAANAPLELASVNGEPVTGDDLRRAFVKRHGGHEVFLGGDVEARRFLDIVINERLLVQEAYNLHLDEDPLIAAAVKEFRERQAVDYLWKTEVADKVEPSPEEVRRTWEAASEFYLARQIVLDTRAEAESVRAALIAGADFAALARSCSIANTRARGGTMPPFSWGAHDVRVEAAVTKLQPGEISEVVHTPDGWQVVQLVDRVEVPRPDFDQVKERVAAIIKKRNDAALSEALADLLWKKYEVQVELDELSVSAIAKLLRTAPATPIAKWNGGELKVKDFLSAGELRMYATFLPGRAAEKIESTLRAAVTTPLARLEAQARNLGEAPAVAEVVDRYEASQLEAALYAKHVLKDVEVTDAEIAAAYEKEKSAFVDPERRRVSHIAVKTEAEAKSLRARIDAGEEWKELVKSHSLDEETKKSAGDLGWIARGKVGAHWDTVWALPKEGVSQPIKSEQAWHLIRVTAIAPPRTLPFEEVKASIKENLFEKKKHDAREYWIKKLRDAARVDVHAAAIKSFIEEKPYKQPK